MGFIKKMLTSLAFAWKKNKLYLFLLCFCQSQPPLNIVHKFKHRRQKKGVPVVLLLLKKDSIDESL